MADDAKSVSDRLRMLEKKAREEIDARFGKGAFDLLRKWMPRLRKSMLVSNPIIISPGQGKPVPDNKDLWMWVETDEETLPYEAWLYDAATNVELEYYPNVPPPNGSLFIVVFSAQHIQPNMTFNLRIRCEDGGEHQISVNTLQQVPVYPPREG